MKRHGRALHFAVTGALLGGVGIGCANKGVTLTNTGYMDEPEPEEQLHVNPGPDEDPGAAEGGAAEGGVAEGGAADGAAAEGGTPEEPQPRVNPGPSAEPEPKPPVEPDISTNNVRKVDDPGSPSNVKHPIRTNVRKVEEP
jgi:hypothetical protein